MAQKKESVMWRGLSNKPGGGGIKPCERCWTKILLVYLMEGDKAEAYFGVLEEVGNWNQLPRQSQGFC